MTPSLWKKAGVLAAVAAGLAVVVCTSGAQPGYDTSWHLVWAHQILGGHAPSFNAWAAPTEHPLLVAIALVAALVGGSSSGPVMVALTLLALVVLLVEMRRLAQAVFDSSASGVIAWVMLAGAYGLLLQALRGYLDVWFLLLVTTAAVRIAVRKRADSGWLALLLAGLLRPEAWLLAGVAASVGWKQADNASRVRSLAAIGLPPAIWFGLDGLVTGRPLLGFETASNLEVTGGGGPLHVLTVALVGGLRGPATLVGLIGVALAWQKLGRRQVALPLVLIATGLGTALAIAVAGLTLLPRYLLLCDLGLVLFGGFALVGWTAGQPQPVSWRRAGLGAIILAVIAAISLGAPQTLVDEVQLDADTHAELTSILDDTDVRRGLNCGPLTFPSFRLIPEAKLVLDDPLANVRGRAEQPVPDSGVAITLNPSADTRLIERYGHPGINLPYDEKVPIGFKPIALPTTESSALMQASSRCPG